MEIYFYEKSIFNSGRKHLGCNKPYFRAFFKTRLQYRLIQRKCHLRSSYNQDHHRDKRGELILEQIEKQIAKLCDVINVTELEPGDSVTRELMLVKIAVTAERRQEVLSLITVFKGKVVDVTHDTMVIEVTGHTGKLESVLDMISDYEILELARTGITGLKRGGKAYNPPAEQEL